MQAINKVHQVKVNKAITWLTKYNMLNNQRDHAHDNDNEILYKKYDKLCQNAFDKYLTIVDELPKRERAQIEKSELY
jgi:hypothetical protein